MSGKRKPVAEFNNDEWMCEFAFVVDTNTHLNQTHISNAKIS